MLSLSFFLVFVFVSFLFSIVITSLWEERTDFYASRVFVYFILFILYALPLRKVFHVN